MQTEAQKKATAKYRKAKGKQVGGSRSSPPDADLYEHLKAQPNMSGYIKELIRRDMERRG